MPKMRKKPDLPSKTCAACKRPFVWRKKWQRDWDNVRFCSDRCRAKKPEREKCGVEKILEARRHIKHSHANQRFGPRIQNPRIAHPI